MKRLFLAILIILLLGPIAQAQEPIYLPVVVSNMAVCDRTWRFIEPDGTSNEVLNPSFETTGGFVAGGGAVVTRTAAEGKYGLYGLRVQTAGDNQGVVISTATLANAAHYATLRVKGALPPNWYWSIDNGTTFHAPRHIEDIDDDWSLYGFLFPASEANGSTTLVIYQNGAGSGDFYIDGVQVEAKSYWTTYCDGDQAGCEWDGGAHASSSTRSAQSRAGGRLRDFWEDYGFFVEESIGTGASPIAISTRGYALLPGGELTGIKTEGRQFTLVGKFLADSEEELHQNRQALLIALHPGSYPESQPVVIRYSGADEQKEIAAHYEGGLEAQLRASYGPYQVEDERWRKLQRWEERATVRFNAPDPLFREVGESAAVLDTLDSVHFRRVFGRLKRTGQWDILGITNAVTGGNTVFALAEDETYLYVGGNFTGLDNVANTNRIARINKQTLTVSAMGVGLDNIVRAITVGPDGSVYVGGVFTDVQGGPGGTYNRVVRWDPSTSTWNALGAGLNNIVYAFDWGYDGTLYIGGDFTDVQGGPGGTYNRIIAWDGSSYSALGAGMNNSVRAIVVSRDGDVYLGGFFTDVQGGPGGTYNYIVRYDGSAYNALSTGMNTNVRALAILSNGNVLAGGDFTTSGGVTTNYIAEWNGTAFTALGSGTDNIVYTIAVAPNDFVFIGGTFTTAGGITLTDRMAKWNGASWAHLDLDLVGTPIVYSIIAGVSDPVISSNFDVFVGYNSAAAGNEIAGLVTVENAGSYLIYPRIVFERSGGTSAVLYSVRNETTGKELIFDYGLLDGETLTVDLSPTAKSIASSFFTRPLPRPSDAILPNSDFGSFALQQGDNDVSSFVNVAGAPTVTAYMLWRTPYDSLD